MMLLLLCLLAQRKIVVANLWWGTIEPLPSQAMAGVPVLIEALKAADPHVRRTAAQSLDSLWPSPRTAVPALHTTLRDADRGVRLAAAQALTGMEAHQEEVMPVVKVAVRDKDPSFRIQAAQVLARLGPRMKEVLPALGELLKDEHLQVREAAVEGIGRIGPAGGVPLLIRALGDPSPTVREQAAHCLERIGPDAREAWKVLEDLTQEKNHVVRGAVFRALRAINPGEADDLIVFRRLLTNLERSLQESTEPDKQKRGP